MAVNIINPDYQAQLAQMHRQGRFDLGIRMLSMLHPFIDQYHPTSILDFGCGHGALMAGIQETYPDISVEGYDPGNPQYRRIPNRSFDAVVSADVFEHIELEHLAETLQLISNKMTKAGWFRIACYPAKKHLPDGRNAHLIVQPPAWWRQQLLNNMNITIVKEEISTVDKSHKWPGVVGENYDVTVEVK
jgi:cyclopropane fatty-acyl-phospholipid synthase-like methyltransferase